MPSAEEFYRALMGPPTATAPAKPEVYSPVNKSWPTPEDVAFAKANDATYGYDSAPRLQAGVIDQMPITDVPAWANKARSDSPASGPGVPPKDIQDNIYAGWLAAQKSPITALGYNLNNLISSPTNKSSPYLTINGLYDDKADKMWVDPRSPPTLAHESFHRGIRQMRNQNPNVLAPLQSNEEYIVRALMHRNFGNVEGEGRSNRDQVEKGRMLSQFMAPELGELEKKAAELYHKRDRPMGPR